MRASSAIAAAQVLLVLFVLPVLGSKSALAQQDETSDPVTLRGDDYRVQVDPRESTMQLELADGQTLVMLPLSVVLRPSWPPVRFENHEPVQVLRARSASSPPPDQGDPTDPTQSANSAPPDDPGDVNAVAVLLNLTAEGVDEAVRAGIRPGPFGPVVSLAVPLARETGRKIVVTGGSVRRDDHDTIVIHAPDELTVLLQDAGLDPVRVRGVCRTEGPPDAEFGLQIRADGEALFGLGPETADGWSFDVVLPPDAGRITFSVREPATRLELVGVTFRTGGPGGRPVPLMTLLESSWTGLDVFESRDGATDAEVRVPASSCSLDLRIDASEASSDGTGIPFVTLSATADQAIGVGLAQAPDVTYMAAQDDRVLLDLSEQSGRADTRAGATSMSLNLIVILAPTVDELLPRYHETLQQVGLARRRDNGTRPGWWSRPLLLLSPSTTRTFDARALGQIVNRAQRLLGGAEFTVVVDGPWSLTDGDPRARPAFGDLRSLVADQHLDGRSVLLRWPLLAADIGSLADTYGLSAGNVLDVSQTRQLRDFLADVTRRCLSTELDGLGADGFLIEDVARGSGLGDVDRLTRLLAAAATSTREDALLVGPLAAPQLGGVEGVLVRDATTEKLMRVASVRPFGPVYARPRLARLVGANAPAGNDAQALLEAFARTVVMSAPCIDAAVLDALDPETGAALGAILALTRNRRPGTPERVGSRIVVWSGDELVAETLQHDAGAIMYPGEDDAVLALTRAGDVVLPFTVRGEHPDIESDPDGSLLVNGQPGRDYRFARIFRKRSASR